jgi:hypothetical protein
MSEELRLYSNNNRIFGRLQNFYFYIKNDLSVNQINANNLKEIKKYLVLKYNKNTERIFKP